MNVLKGLCIMAAAAVSSGFAAVLVELIAGLAVIAALIINEMR